MALEDKDLFEAIFKKYGNQSIDFVMEQYEKAKLLNMAIEKRILEQNKFIIPVRTVDNLSQEQKVHANQEAILQKKSYSKEDFVCVPENAIQDTCITCCLCGKQALSLTSRHLSTHGISPDEYKFLCGYDQNQKLMARNYLVKRQANALRAQEARATKKLGERA